MFWCLEGGDHVKSQSLNRITNIRAPLSTRNEPIEQNCGKKIVHDSSCFGDIIKVVDVYGLYPSPPPGDDHGILTNGVSIKPKDRLLLFQMTEDAAVAILFLWRRLSAQRGGGGRGRDQLEGKWTKMATVQLGLGNYSRKRSHLMEAESENTQKLPKIQNPKKAFHGNMFFTLTPAFTCVSSVSRTITHHFATWTQRECATALRFPWADPPSSCTTAWPNSWLILYRDHSRAMPPTAFWRGTTPRTLRQLSNMSVTETCWSENTPCIYLEGHGSSSKSCFFFFFLVSCCTAIIP